MHRSNMTLNHAPVHQALIVRAVQANQAPTEWVNWLEDIGFLAGEHAMVLKRPVLKGGALVVRVGLSTFALHPQEASCIEVTAVTS
ncbi:MAG: FeoA family protein [Formosimonas sp.]